MDEVINENIKSDVLPYDFVKEKNVIASKTKNGYLVTSPRKLSKNLYQEVQRFLNSSFKFELCDPGKFNEILTNSFAATNHQNDISEELSDEFDLQDFAGSIDATEDLLSGNNDTPIIKLINGIISQAIKSRASDIHFEPYEDHIAIRFRIDGILKEILSIPINEPTNPIRIPSGFLILNINELRETKKEINLEDELEKIVKIKTNNQLDQFSNIYFNKIKKNIVIYEN